MSNLEIVAIILSVIAGITVLIGWVVWKKYTGEDLGNWKN